MEARLAEPVESYKAQHGARFTVAITFCIFILKNISRYAALFTLLPLEMAWVPQAQLHDKWISLSCASIAILKKAIC